MSSYDQDHQQGSDDGTNRYQQPLSSSLMTSPMTTQLPSTTTTIIQPFEALDIEPKTGHGNPLDKKEKKKLKKRNKRRDDEQDAAHVDDLVSFMLPNGELIELREFSEESQNKYDVKIHMANERTFFKYLFASFQLGAIGTFLLTYFPQGDEKKLFLVAMIWITAFSFIFWGLFAYYHRKALMNEGRLKDTSHVNPHGPAYVLVMFIVVFLSIIMYAVVTHQSPSKQHPRYMTNNAASGGDGRSLPPPLITSILGAAG